MRRPQRNMLVWAALMVVVIILGVGSRRYGHVLPGFLSTYAGDTLWALLVFLLIGLILPTVSPQRVALLALTLSALVEVSQLYHAPWIDSIRRTTLGGLVLGFGFLWSDLACYAVGVGFGAVAETLLLRVSHTLAGYTS